MVWQRQDVMAFIISWKLKQEYGNKNKTTKAHGFARQKGQEVMDERLAFNACLKN